MIFNTTGFVTAALQDAIDTSTTPYETGSSDVVEIGRGTCFVDRLVLSNVVEIEGRGKHVTTIKWSGVGGTEGANAGLIVSTPWVNGADYNGPPITIRNLTIDAQPLSVPGQPAPVSKNFGIVLKNYNFVIENCIIRGAGGSEVLISSSGPGNTGAGPVSGGAIRDCQIGQGEVTADNGIEFRDPSARITDCYLHHVDVQRQRRNGIVCSGGTAAGLIMQGCNIAVAGDYSLDIRNPGKAANVGNSNLGGNCRLTVLDSSLGLSKLSNMSIGGQLDVMFEPSVGYENEPLTAGLDNIDFGPVGYLTHYGNKTTHTTVVRGGFVKTANPFRRAPGALGRVIYNNVFDLQNGVMLNGAL